MSPTVPNKDSLDFLSDYYFDTKSPPVAFTSPLALYQEAKKRYPSLTFRQVKTWLQAKDTYTLHKPVRYHFPRNRVIVIETDDYVSVNSKPDHPLPSPGQLLWWANSPSPPGKKSSKPQSPGPIKQTKTPPTGAFVSIIHYKKSCKTARFYLIKR